METIQDVLDALGLDETADARAIRRAYARRLKLIDQAEDLAGFQALRSAYETALDWCSWRDAKAQTEAQTETYAASHAEVYDGAAVHGDGPVLAAAESVALHETQAATEPGAPKGNVLPEAPAYVLPSAALLAEQVFGRFTKAAARLCGSAGVSDPLPWSQELQRCLDDDALLNIDARTGFEARIAWLLAQGWHPGHEGLFPAACEVFEWRHDRRRLAQFGDAGRLLDQATDELSVYEAQQDDMLRLYRSVGRQLRQARRPKARELRANIAAVEELAKRFPALVHVAIGDDNIAQWRSAYRDWRAKGGRFYPEEGTWIRRCTRFLKWLVVAALALIVLSVVFPPDGTHSRSRRKPPSAEMEMDPAPTQQQLKQHIPPPRFEVPADARPGTLSVDYQVFLDIDGKVLGLNQMSWSGLSAFDVAVADAIKAATPFPKGTAVVFPLRYSVEIEGKTTRAARTKPETPAQHVPNPPYEGMSVLPAQQAPSPVYKGVADPRQR